MLFFDILFIFTLLEIFYGLFNKTTYNDKDYKLINNLTPYIFIVIVVLIIFSYFSTDIIKIITFFILIISIIASSIINKKYCKIKYISYDNKSTKTLDLIILSGLAIYSNQNVDFILYTFNYEIFNKVPMSLHLAFSLGLGVSIVYIIFGRILNIYYYVSEAKYKKIFPDFMKRDKVVRYKVRLFSIIKRNLVIFLGFGTTLVLIYESNYNDVIVDTVKFQNLLRFIEMLFVGVTIPAFISYNLIRKNNNLSKYEDYYKNFEKLIENESVDSLDDL